MVYPVINDPAIEPINQQQKNAVVEATERCIQRAGLIYQREFARLPVLFDLQGKSLGLYQRSAKSCHIRYNPWFFAKYYEDSLRQAVPHEVAHYVVDCLWGIKRVKPHGMQWRAVMVALGAQPSATGNYDLSGIPQRQYRRFSYDCGCKTHALTATRHHRVQKGQASYHCRQCHNLLQLSPP